MYTDRQDDEEPRLAHPLRNAGYVVLGTLVLSLMLAAILMVRMKAEDPTVLNSIADEFSAYVGIPV